MRIFLRVPLLLRTLFFKITACIINPSNGLIQVITASGHTHIQRGIMVFPRYITNTDKMFFPGWFHLKQSAGVISQPVSSTTDQQKDAL